MAKLENVEVKVDGKVIGIAEVKSFDSVEEAVTELGNDKCLKLINAKTKSDTTNLVRMKHLQDTPENQMGRLLRAAKKGTVTKEDAKAKIADLLAQLG